MIEITNEEFLDNLFEHTIENADTTIHGFRGDPNDTDGRTKYRAHKPNVGSAIMDGVGLNTYCCVSSFYYSPKNQIHRRKADFAALHVLMIDDIGTGIGSHMSIDNLKLVPTYLIETSPDNFQAWYKLSTPITDFATADKFISAMVYQGITVEDEIADPGMLGVTRLGRMPVGINGKPKYGGWDVQCLIANDLEYSMDDIVQAWNLDLDAVESKTNEYQKTDVEEMDDLRLLSLYSLNLVKSKLPNGGYDISCPWIANHTGGDNGTIYFPAQGFHCHHGHCVDKTLTDLDDFLIAQGCDISDFTLLQNFLPDNENANGFNVADDPAFVNQQEQEDTAAAKTLWLKENIVYMEPQGWYDLDNNIFCPSRQTLNDFYGQYTYMGEPGRNGVRPAITPTKQLNPLADKLTAQGLIWKPVPDDEVYPLYDEAGRKYVNTYKPYNKNPIAGDTEHWDCLMEFIYREHTELVKDWLAFTLQFPWIKITWGIFVVGQLKRNGKSATVAPIAFIMGELASTVSAQNIQQGWDDAYIQSKLIIMEEVYDFTGKAFNTMKIKLGNTGYELLNPKSKAQIKQWNVYSQIMFSNEAGAMKMDIDEGKLLVIDAPECFIDGKSDLPMDEETSTFYAEYWDHIRDPQYQQAILHQLLERDVSSFRYNSPPPITQAHKNTVEEAQGDFEKYIDVLIQKDEVPFCQPWLELHHLKQILTDHGYKAGLKSIAKALRHKGYESYKGQKYNPNGKNQQPTFWALKTVIEKLIPDLAASKLCDYYNNNTVEIVRKKPWENSFHHKFNL